MHYISAILSAMYINLCFKTYITFQIASLLGVKQLFLIHPDQLHLNALLFLWRVLL